MAKRQIMIQVQVSNETKEKFREFFVGSGANSNGEFINMLLENYANPEIIETEVERIVERPVEKVVEKLVEVIKEVEKPVEVIKEVSKTLEKNQILISLTPIQQALLKESVENDETIEIHNYYAISEDYQEKHPDMLLPLVEGENNIGRFLTNLFFIQLLEGSGDWIHYLSNSEMRNILENLPESDNTDELDNIE